MLSNFRKRENDSDFQNSGDLILSTHLCHNSFSKAFTWIYLELFVCGPYQRNYLMPQKGFTLLRIILTIAFALPAFIFSEVVPDVQPLNHTLIRMVLSFWFGLLGYGLFPNLSKLTTLT